MKVKTRSRFHVLIVTVIITINIYSVSFADVKQDNGLLFYLSGGNDSSGRGVLQGYYNFG